MIKIVLLMIWVVITAKLGSINAIDAQAAYLGLTLLLAGILASDD